VLVCRRIHLVLFLILATLSHSEITSPQKKKASKSEPSFDSLATRGRRVLVHAAPGSGGSLFTFLLAQNNNAIAFPNLRVAPPLVVDLADIPREADVILKVTLGDSNTSLIEAIERFQPDIKILLLKHPASLASILQPGGEQNRMKVSSKTRPGDLMSRETILKRLEWTWSMSSFQWDAIVLFEELLFNSAVIRQKLRGAGFSDFELDKMDRMTRTKKDIERYNGKNSRWSRKYRNPSKYARSDSAGPNNVVGWDFGGVSRSSVAQLAHMRQDFPNQVPSTPYRIMAKKFCPSLSQYYAEHHPELEVVNTNNDWLVAVRRLHKLIDERAAIFKHVSSSASYNNIVTESASAHHTPLRERWIVMTFASLNWVQSGIVFNWMASLHRVEIENYLIVSLEQSAHDALAAMSVSSFFHETHDNKEVILAGGNEKEAMLKLYFASLLSYKWKLLSAILKRGVSVLFSDADTVFLRDIRPLFESSHSHIIAGRGQSKGLIIRAPVLLLRSSVEVLHLLPRLIAATSHFKNDEVALNRVFNGVIGWAEPPLKPESWEHFIEGKTFRSVSTTEGALFDTLSGQLSADSIKTETSSSSSSSLLKGPLDASLRITLVPNRVFRFYDCSKGFPLESAYLLHCANETKRALNLEPLGLVMNRMGKLEEPQRPVKLIKPADYITGDETHDRLVELGLWMLSPKWRQQYDLIQAKVNRHVPGETRYFGWDQLHAWVQEVTVWSVPTRAAEDQVVYGAAQKNPHKARANNNALTSPHNKKKNCRYVPPKPEEAAYVLPAIKCDP
jgi:hypothetical protein